jgi:hypothetical protein
MGNDVSRRDFVKTAGSVAAASLVLGDSAFATVAPAKTTLRHRRHW